MRLLGDLGDAEDVAQDALLEATRRWPRDGIPANPGAWLTTVAKNRALNRIRDRKRRGGQMLGLEDLAARSSGDPAADLDAHGDDRLRLVLMCCHPCLGKDAQVALTLRLVAGLTVREIASAFVLPEPTIAQRISRAKRTLRTEGVEFALPSADTFSTALGAVLEVIYLIFNEGHGPHNDDLRRRLLCREAITLGTQLTEVAPAFPDAWALTALMLFQSSRFDARTGPHGDLIPLDEQDRARWDRDTITRAEAALTVAHNTVRREAPVGRFVIEAEIAAQHARASRFSDTDWERIDTLYSVLVELTGNPVASLNWAVARSYVDGPSAGLEALDELGTGLEGYHLFDTVKADLHRRAGDAETAAGMYAVLASQASTSHQRAFYSRRRDECDPGR